MQYSAATMRLLTTFVLLSASLTHVHGLSLSQFQPIVSFPSACTAAYDTPISDCSAQDFEGGNPCSKDCIANLQAISNKINTACVGSRADPTTLIGLFFQGQGVGTLCPNSVPAGAGPSEAGNSNGIGSSTMVASSRTVDTSIAAATSSASAGTTSTSTDVFSETSSSEPTSKTSTSSSSVSISTTAAITSAASPTSSGSRTTSPALRGGFTSTAVNNGVASVITSKAQQTANPDGFGGGGSPFEVGVNGGSSVEAGDAQTLLAVFMLVGLGFLLR